MADGTVRGAFELSAEQPIRDLTTIRDRGREADQSLRSLGGTMDRMGGTTADQRLSSYTGKLEKVGTTAEQTAGKVATSWAAQRKSIDDESTRIEARIDKLEAKLDSFGRKRATARVDLTGYDLVNAQLTELEARLTRLDRRRATPHVSLGGGFSLAGGGGGGGGVSSTGGSPLLSSLGGIPGRLPWWAAIAPLAPQLLGGAGGLLASAGSAALGVGSVGLGAAGSLGFGGALTAGLAKPAFTELSALTKDQTAYNTAVQEFGRQSTQATTAQRKLNEELVQAGPAAAAAARQVGLLRSTFQNVTAPGRSALLGGVSTAAYNVRGGLQQLRPDFTMAGQATGQAATQFSQFLVNPQSMQTYHTLTASFATELPTVEKSLQNIVTIFEHLAVAALPFFHEANTWVQQWTAGMASSSADTARVQAKMQDMVTSARDWGNMLGAAYRLLKDIFSAGVPSGNSLVVQFTNSLERWDAWIRTNPDKVRKFFSDGEQAVGRIATVIGNLATDIWKIFQALSPIFSRAEQFLQFASGLGGGNIAIGGALLYGGYQGARGALGGRGPTPGAAAASVIRGGPSLLSLAGGGGGGGGATAQSVAGLSRASNTAVARGVTSSGAFLMGPATTGTEAVLQQRAQAAEARIAEASRGAMASRVVAATEALSATRVGQVVVKAAESVPAALAKDAIATGTEVGRGFLSGAARMAAPVLAISGILEGFAPTGGGAAGHIQNALSGATLGIIPKYQSQSQQGQQWAQQILGGLPIGQTPGQQFLSTSQAIGALQRVPSFFRGTTNPAIAAIAQTQTSALASQANQVTTPAQAQQIARTVAQVRLELPQSERAKFEQYLTTIAQTAANNAGIAASNSWQDAFSRGLNRVGAKKAVATMLEGMTSQLRQLGPQGSEQFVRSTAEWVHQMELDNPKLRGPLEKLMKGLISDLNNMNRQAGLNMKGMQDTVFFFNDQILKGSDTTWQAISDHMTNRAAIARDKLSGIWGQIQQEAIDALTQMGFTKDQAKTIVTSTALATTTHSTAVAGAATSIAAGTAAAGPAGVAPGSASPGVSGTGVLKARGGGMVAGSGLLDTVALPDGSKAAPGEAWIANRHTMMDLSSATLEKFGKTAWQMIRDEDRAHSAPMGNFRAPGSQTRHQAGAVGAVFAAAGQAAGSTGFGGYSLPLPRAQMMPGSWSIDQGVDIPAGAGTPEYAIGPGQITGAGISGFGPNAPILRISSGPLAGRSIYYGHAGPNTVPVGAQVGAGQQISEVGAGIVGISTGPHIEIGFYPPGGMGAGGSMATVLRQLLSGAGVTGVGAIGGAGLAGAAAPVRQITLKAPKTGLGGVPGAMADRGSTIEANTLQQKVNQTLATTTLGAAGAPMAGTPGGGTPSANQSLGRQMMLAQGWPASEWPALQALWTQESGWNANSVNSASGAYGIPQALGHGHPFNLGDAPAQIAWGLNYIRQRYGSPSAAEAHERSFNWYQRGGQASWAGWNAKGADFVTRGPTLVGAGEKGRERVTVTPVGRAGGGGGHHITVRMENVHLSAQPHEIEHIGREVAAQILAALDDAGGGVTDAELAGAA